MSTATIVEPTKISRFEFMEMLYTMKGAKIATFVSRTVPALYKNADNPFCKKDGRKFVIQVVKLSEVNGMVGWNYANSVNNQREREGHEEIFVPEPRAWGRTRHS
jgi:hypothetical protein